MNQPPDHETMTRYLLGLLPEAEAEVCDEMSIIDDEFAAHLQAAEDDLIDAYVRGELAGHERAQFESYYLASPRRREKVNFARALQKFVDGAAPAAVALAAAETARPASADETKLPATPSATERPSRRKALLSLFAVPHLSLQWGFAAAAAVTLLAGGWLLFETLRLRGQVDRAAAERGMLRQREQELQTQLERQQAGAEGLARASRQNEEELKRMRAKLAELEQRAKLQPPPLPAELNIAHFDLAPQTRGVGQVATLTVPPGADYVALQLDLESDGYISYRAALRSQGSKQIVWESGTLEARARDTGKVIDISIRAGLLTSQRYVLEITGVTASGAEPILGYPFRVVKQ
jgi:anti-sigma factor RsiW